MDQAYGPQADVWALGCVLYEMLSGEQAFPVHDHDTESKFYGRIRAGHIDTDRGPLKKISDDAKSLLKGMLKVDPTQRLSASECLVHPWITGHAHTEEHTASMPHVQQAMGDRIAKRKGQ